MDHQLLSWVFTPAMRSLFFALVATLLPFSAFSAVPDFSSAQSVDVYHLAPISEPQIAIPKKFHGCQILAGPKRLSQSDARTIAHDLELIHPIDWPPMNCPFVIRCGLRFHFANGNNVDVLLSPSCGEVHFMAGKELRRSDMNGYREDLLRRLNRLFPGHPFRARQPNRRTQPALPLRS